MHTGWKTWQPDVDPTSAAPARPSQLPHNGQGRSLKSTGPPRPASASSKDIMTAMAASSLLGLLEPGSSMMSMLRWELSPLQRATC